MVDYNSVDVGLLLFPHFGAICKYKVQILEIKDQISNSRRNGELWYSAYWKCILISFQLTKGSFWALAQRVQNTSIETFFTTQGEKQKFQN